MNRVLVLTVLLLPLLLIHGNTEPPRRTIPEANIDFFLQNNTGNIGFMDTLSTYSQLLCINDNVRDRSVAERMRVAKLCLDSQATEEEYYIVFDGKWHEYVPQAVEEITSMCTGNQDLYELCKEFRR